MSLYTITRPSEETSHVDGTVSQRTTLNGED